VTVAVANGDIDARIGDTLGKLCNTQLAAIRQKASRSDLDELRDMLKRAEKVVQAGIVKETSDRTHQTKGKAK